jgi:hypothetical protein
MRRGAISKSRRVLKNRIANVIGGQGVPDTLAQRIAFQLVFKFGKDELGNDAVWAGVGATVAQELAQLRETTTLEDRQLLETLPKLSATDIERLFSELRREERRIARTIFNAAAEAADPIAAARHYLSSYRGIVERVRDVEPVFARTMANAAFTARTPTVKALEYATRLHADDAADPQSARLVKRKRWWRDKPSSHANDPSEE